MQYQSISLTSGFSIQEKFAEFTDHELHMHDALEVSIAHDPGMKYKIGDASYYTEPGDIVLLRPFEAHWNLTQNEGQPSRWIMLLFSPSFVGVMPRGSSLLTEIALSCGFGSASYFNKVFKALHGLTPREYRKR